jgi:predicted transcriptional regulator
MDLNEVNQNMMIKDFPTISADASLKEAYLAIKKNLEGPPHTPGIVVIDQNGKYAGLLTVDDLMQELSRLYRDACDKPGTLNWFEPFASQCELIGLKKVSAIMSAKRLAVQAGAKFEKSCALILDKKLSLLVVLDDKSQPVGIISRRKVLLEIAPRMFK